MQALRQIAKAMRAWPDFTAMTQHFAAAAAWEALGAAVSGAIGTATGAVAGGSSAVGGARMTAGGRELAGYAATSAPPGIAAGTVSTTAKPQGNLTIMVVGESGAALWMKRTLERATSTQNLRITSGRSRLPTPATR